MAKEKPDHDPSDGSQKPGSTPALPRNVRLVAGIVMAPAQLDLFPIDTGEAGANSAFVSRVFGTTYPVMKELAREVTQRLPPDNCLQIQINQVTTAALISLQIMATKTAPFSRADVSSCTTLGTDLEERLNSVMARIASPAPLVRRPEEMRDLALNEVAIIKQRGIPVDFCYAAFTTPVVSASALHMKLVEARKRSTFLQGEKPEEVRIKGVIKVSQNGERIRVSRVDGDKAVTARIEHGDPLAYVAHAAAAGGIATFVFEKTTARCKAAPEIERVDYRLVRIEADDPSLLPHLTKLVAAGSDLIEQLKRVKR